MSTKKPAHRKVTRAEHQRFVERLTGRSGADKLRLLKEHTEYIDGVRDRDTDFGDAEPRRGRPASAPRRPCVGKDASYLKSNQRFITEHRRKVAAKTLVESGKKRLSWKRKICFVDDDEKLERDMSNCNSVDGDEESYSIQDDDGDSDGKSSAGESDERPDEGQVSFDQENRAVVDFWLPRQWDILDKADMNDFARVVSICKVCAKKDEARFPDMARYLELFSSAYGPTDDVLSVAHDPLKLFFLFMPKDFSKAVAKESHRYFLQNLTARVDRMFEKQKTSGTTTKQQFMNKASKKPDIKPYEVLHVLCLSIACVLNSYRRRFRDHWSRHGVGAVSRGTFNEWMSRTGSNMLWPIFISQTMRVLGRYRPNLGTALRVDVLEKTFPRGYKTPPVISFDEGITSTRNRKNPTRQYLKAKPHK